MNYSDEEEQKSLNKKRFYVKPQNFHYEYNLSLKDDKPTPKLLEYFELIARGWSSKYDNLAKLDVDSCVNYAVTEAWLKWKEYDKKISENIFAFFTQMIKNDLTAHYNNIRKHSKKNISLDVIYNESKK